MDDYKEKGWTTFQIWKEHKAKEWVLSSVQFSSVQRLVKRYKDYYIVLSVHGYPERVNAQNLFASNNLSDLF